MATTAAILIATEWWEPYLPPVIAGAALAILVWIARNVGRIATTARRTEEHVLPHFIPGHGPDTTVPGRLTRLEAETSDLREDLVTHMRYEDDQTKAEAVDREKRQSALDQRLEAGANQINALRIGQAAISAKLDDALDRKSSET